MCVRRVCSAQPDRGRSGCLAVLCSTHCRLFGCLDPVIFQHFFHVVCLQTLVFRSGDGEVIWLQTAFNLYLARGLKMGSAHSVFSLSTDYFDFLCLGRWVSQTFLQIKYIIVIFFLWYYFVFIFLLVTSTTVAEHTWPILLSFAKFAQIQQKPQFISLICLFLHCQKNVI